DGLARMSLTEFSPLRGLGMFKAVTIKAALELARRLGDSARQRDRVAFEGPRSVFVHMRPRFVNETQECFYSLLLATKSQLMRESQMSKGSLNQTVGHPRVALADALRDRVSGVIFVHSHPSGDPSPSSSDKAGTTSLAQTGQI